MRRGFGGVRRLIPLGCVCAAAACVPATAGAASGTGGWEATWTASAQPATPTALARPGDDSAAGFNDQTVRNIVFTSAGGDQVQVRLSNAYSSAPLTVGRVDVAVVRTGARLEPNTDHVLSFGGQTSVTIPPGASELSDPIPMDVPALTDLAVSIYLPGATGPATYHSDAQQVNYVSRTGDFAGQVSGAGFTSTSQSWYYLDGVDVSSASPAAGTVVAFGDSITDGYQSQVGANQRWPNDLARRLAAAGSPLGVADEGISGNRILNDSPCFGTNALSRLDRDVITQPDVKDMILLEGINDIGFSDTPDTGCSVPNTDVSAAQLIAADQQIIERAHAAGIKVYGATLTPFKGASYWTPAGERKREALNQWIMTSGAFDGVIDFASAVADPLHPKRMNPAYDSGDHLHPNDAGYQAMADAIPLGALG